MVFGADLCVLGGTKHPSCWEPLKNAWHELDQRERERISVSRAQAMLDRGLIAALPSRPANSVRYVLSDDLRILLAARELAPRGQRPHEGPGPVGRRRGASTDFALDLQVKERAEYPPHGGQLGRGNGADAAVQALVGDRPGVLRAGKRRQLAQPRRL